MKITGNDWRIMVKCFWKDCKPIEAAKFARVVAFHKDICISLLGGEGLLASALKRSRMAMGVDENYWAFKLEKSMTILDDFQMVSFVSCNFISNDACVTDMDSIASVLSRIACFVYRIYDMPEAEEMLNGIEVSFTPIDDCGNYNFCSRWTIEENLVRKGRK